MKKLMQLFESAEKMQNKLLWNSETMGPRKRQASKLGFNNWLLKSVGLGTLASDIRDELAITYLEQ